MNALLTLQFMIAVGLTPLTATVALSQAGRLSFGTMVLSPGIGPPVRLRSRCSEPSVTCSVS